MNNILAYQFQFVKLVEPVWTAADSHLLTFESSDECVAVTD